jgi:hypothetical protein
MPRQSRLDVPGAMRKLIIWYAQYYNRRVGVPILYLKIVINPFSAMKRLSFELHSFKSDTGQGREDDGGEYLQYQS